VRVRECLCWRVCVCVVCMYECMCESGSLWTVQCSTVYRGVGRYCGNVCAREVLLSCVMVVRRES
jgi:hypothetical protein